jgi:hypothetical protein
MYSGDEFYDDDVTSGFLSTTEPGGDSRMTTTKSVAAACREAWASQRVEVIARVADALRFQQGLDFAQVHQTFVITTGKEISLAKFDEIMRLADEGFSGTLGELSRGRF